MGGGAELRCRRLLCGSDRVRVGCMGSMVEDERGDATLATGVRVWGWSDTVPFWGVLT